MKRLEKLRPLLLEFSRYCLAGGGAFLLDAGTLFLLREYLLPELDGYRLYVAAAAGFTVGLVFNYILSVLFVFRDTRDGRAGRSASAFAVFAVIGVVGLGLTELGMYAGTAVLELHYLPVKVLVTGIVLIWNYLGRKLLIFR